MLKKEKNQNHSLAKREHQRNSLLRSSELEKEFKSVENANKSFKRNLMYSQLNDLKYHKEYERQTKLRNLDLERRILNDNELEKQRDKNREINYKNQLKSVAREDLLISNNKKNLERYNLMKENQLNYNVVQTQMKLLEEKENAFKNKMNTINNKLYDKVLAQNHFFSNNEMKSPFMLRNDNDFNKHIAENKAKEKELIKNDQEKLIQRIKEVCYYL